MKTTRVVAMANIKYIGYLKVVGGLIPKIKSLIIPPPTAVVIPRKATPKRSICFWQAVTAPDMAKAMVATISNIKIASNIHNPFCIKNRISRTIITQCKLFALQILLEVRI